MAMTVLPPVLSSYRSPWLLVTVPRASRRRGKSCSSVSCGINRISKLYRVGFSPLQFSLSLSLSLCVCVLILLGILRLVVARSSPHLPRNIPFVPRHVPRGEEPPWRAVLPDCSISTESSITILFSAILHRCLREWASERVSERGMEEDSHIRCFLIFFPLVPSSRRAIKFRKLRPVNRDTRVERESSFSIYIATMWTDLTMGFSAPPSPPGWFDLAPGSHPVSWSRIISPRCQLTIVIAFNRLVKRDNVPFSLREIVLLLDSLVVRLWKSYAVE